MKIFITSLIILSVAFIVVLAFALGRAAGKEQNNEQRHNEEK